MKQLNILCVAFPNWEGDYIKSTVELFKIIGESHNVIYVNYQPTIKDWLLKKLPFFNIKKNTNGKISVVQPIPGLPINWLPKGFWYNVGLQINGFLLHLSIQKSIKNLQITPNVILNAFNPFSGLPLLKYYKNIPHIYYCYDDITSAPWCEKHGGYLEHQYIKTVPLTLTSSTNLLEIKKQISPNIKLVKNGVNFDLFQNGFTHTNRETILYIGSIDSRLDYELLQKCFLHLDNYEFLFVGRIMDNKYSQFLTKYENVSVLGPKDAHELPEILQQAKIGLIPFVKNQFTKNIYRQSL